MDNELELTRELGELQKHYSILDKSEDNQAIGKRISEIRKELDLIQKPKKNKRKSRLVNKKHN